MSDKIREDQLKLIAAKWRETARLGCVDAFECALKDAWDSAIAEVQETKRLDWVLFHRPEFEDGYLRVWQGVSSDGPITREGHYIAEGATPRECIDNAMAGKLRLID